MAPERKKSQDSSKGLEMWINNVFSHYLRKEMSSGPLSFFDPNWLLFPLGIHKKTSVT